MFEIMRALLLLWYLFIVFLTLVSLFNLPVGLCTNFEEKHMVTTVPLTKCATFQRFMVKCSYEIIANTRETLG